MNIEYSESILQSELYQHIKPIIEWGVKQLKLENIAFNVEKLTLLKGRNPSYEFASNTIFLPSSLKFLENIEHSLEQIIFHELMHAYQHHFGILTLSEPEKNPMSLYFHARTRVWKDPATGITERYLETVSPMRTEDSIEMEFYLNPFKTCYFYIEPDENETTDMKTIVSRNAIYCNRGNEYNSDDYNTLPWEIHAEEHARILCENYKREFWRQVPRV